MGPNEIQIMVQAGGVGIAFYALYIIRKFANGQSDRMSKALEQNTDAWLKNSEMMGKFSEKLDELTRR